MTTGFHQLEIGDEVELKGPLGSFVWQGNGTAMYRGVPRKYKQIGMICGGSGAAFPLAVPILLSG